MYSIRRDVFETNSSSTHSLVICNDQEYKDWKNRKLMYDVYAEKFIDANKFTITPHQYQEGQQHYEDNKTKYMKDWIDLTEDEQKSYLFEFIILIINDYDPYQYKDYNDYVSEMQNQEESFEKKYTTPRGDVVHVLGYFGHD